MDRYSWRAALLLLAFSVSFAPSAHAQFDLVLEEDFEGKGIDGELLNNAQIVDLEDGRGSLLSLTQGENSQSGFAWFNQPFGLQEERVRITFDAWIRPGQSAVPADGMSVIFQFGNNTAATGGGGGGLGTTNFPTEYVSVAFDIWDNGANDPETVCDSGAQHTCHIEVNQNSNPGAQPSVQTNVDFGVDAPDFTTVGDTLVPIRVQIDFNNGSIEVRLQTDEDPNFADPVLVLQSGLEAFPEGVESIIGFAASTGGANAHHEIDNLLIEAAEACCREREMAPLGGGTRGAINCGSNVEVTGMVGGESYTFVADASYGNLVGTENEESCDGDSCIVETIAGYGWIYGNAVGGPADPPIDVTNVGDENLQAMYQTERWANGPVGYQFDVQDGRYEVNLHFAEICPCGVSATGDGTRHVSARVEGDQVLTHWSAAQAAGAEAGSSDAIMRRAVVRTFQVDVTDGALNVTIIDTGLTTNPPENAQINGISYRRLGDATGADSSGDIEDSSPVHLPANATLTIVDTDFDDDEVGVCPDGVVCNTNTAGEEPRVVDFSDFHQLGLDSPRLRLTSNAGSLGNTAIFEESADLGRFDFEASFDVFLTRDLLNGNPPADGMTFFFISGTEDVLTTLGAAGGGLGYHQIPGDGFAVEVDTWSGANDPSGANTNGYGHVGLVTNGDVTAHLQHNFAQNPDTDPAEWPVSLLDDPKSLENGQWNSGTFALEEAGTAGVHVECELNNDRFRVWVSSINDEPTEGPTYPRTLVVDTLLSYAVSGLGEGFFGFSAGTGGAVTWHEVDNVRIDLIRNKDVNVTRHISPSTYTDSSTTIDVTLNISVEADTGDHTLAIADTLPAGWTAENFSDGGSFADGVVSFSLSGLNADSAATYRLVPSDDTRGDATLSGTFNPDSTVDLPIGTSLVGWLPPQFPRGEGEILIAEDFDDYAQGDCPDGATCNSNAVGFDTWKPVVTQDPGREGRLQLTDDANSRSGSVIWNEPVDLLQNSFVAEFDVYISDPTAANFPADGMTFMVLDAAVNDQTALGLGGGGIGYQNLSGFAVEIDTWSGGEDPSGYNTTGYAHVAVVRDGVVAAHVQTCVDFDPTLVPISAGGEGWPNFVDQTGGAGVPLHFEISYNNGGIEVWMSAPDTTALAPGGGAGGIPFDRVKVLETVVKFNEYDSEDTDPVLPLAHIGFSAGTGGAVSFHEVDNYSLTLYDKDDGGQPGVGFTRGDTDGNGQLLLNDSIQIFGWLFQGAAEPGCVAAADASGQGQVNLTSGIYGLNFLFTGGPAPPAPFPDCAKSASEADLALGCLNEHCP